MKPVRSTAQSTPNTSAIGYVRVSTDKQEISPDVQRERIASYCSLHGLQLTEVLTETVSAKIRLNKRPAGKRIADLVSSGASHVVALKLDRLFRNTSDALDTIEAWNQAGVSLHVVDMGGQSIDTRSSIGRMFVTMVAAFAEFERNVISERTTAALRHKKANGERTGGRVPFGFDCVDGRLVSNDREQAGLISIRLLRDSGWSYQSIARKLNREGIVSKTGGKWHPFTVQCVLSASESIKAHSTEAVTTEA